MKCNQPPLFTDDMNNHILKEDTEVGTVVYTLKGYDPENSTVKYGILGTDVLTVNPESGEVTLVKPLDREVCVIIIIIILNIHNDSVVLRLLLSKNVSRPTLCDLLSGFF